MNGGHETQGDGSATSAEPDRGLHFDFARFFRARPVLLAPMEEVSDATFRAVCRARGASLAFTEFVHAEHLRDDDAVARARMDLSRDEGPTAVQIYGADPAALELAARTADEAEPAFVDINCGCWVPRVIARGAGGAWLREPEAMVAMAARVVRAVSRPVTVKTRVGFGPESHMPLDELAKRLEGAGVRAITVHCRTVRQGYEGRADWSHAARAQRAVQIPVVVNGDVASAADARRALEQTGCAGVMIGRRAIEHPWVFREARALLDEGRGLAPPSRDERFAAMREHAVGLGARGLRDRAALRALRRFAGGYLRGTGADVDALVSEATLAAFLARLDEAATQRPPEPPTRGLGRRASSREDALDDDEPGLSAARSRRGGRSR